MAELDNAFEALKTYGWGTDPAPLDPIDRVVYASQPGTQKELEARLVSVFRTGAPRAAKEFACRKLALIGSAQSVAGLAGLLPDKDLSHMACYALERIPGPEADKALRDALPKLEGRNRMGVVHALGVRRDARSVSQLAALLNGEPETAAAAAFSLGWIGNSEAAKALKGYREKAPATFRPVAADASMICARRLIANGKIDEGVAILQALASEDQPEYVRTAAKHAISAAYRL
ncbi:MAG: hypothetical protein M1436_06630 [Acidobacteria bacterium]|nr:hypothetical protein [Acidobacteriota bacterium]